MSFVDKVRDKARDKDAMHVNIGIQLRMSAIRLLLIGWSAVAAWGGEQPGEERLLLLRNARAVLGVWLEAGGRVAVYRANDGRNVLYGDPDQWSRPEAIPPPGHACHFVPYHGHVVWLSPQSLWWSQQTVNASRRERKAIWPPDPYLDRGAYRVTERDATSVTLVSPESPVSGVCLTKRYQLHDDGSVALSYTLRNIRNEPVSWGLWSNTRVAGTQYAYVPVTETGLCPRVEGHLPLRQREGFVYLDAATSVPDGQDDVSGKLFLQPRAGVVATFGRGHCFLKAAPLPAPGEVHPDHEFVEIYQRLHRRENDSLLELEMQGVYRTLKPGESLSFSETWRLLPYDGTNEPAAHLRFLQPILSPHPR